MNDKEIANDGLIFKTLTGSTAYGTNLPTSDIDYRGIFIAPMENVVTGMFPIDQYQDPVEDLVYYELRKFVKLLVDQNPNILELLWVDEGHIQFRTAEYDFLRGMREKLLSSKVKFTFSGYAHSQLQRLKNHNKWVNNAKPKTPPRQSDYLFYVRMGAESQKAVDAAKSGEENTALYRVYGGLMALVREEGKKPIHKDTGEVLVQPTKVPEDADIIGYLSYDQTTYNGAKNEWKGYWEWREKRNKTRLATEDEFGYDTKHAMHSIRLLRMGKEILEDGVVNVFRDDAEELLTIREGKFTLSEILEMSDDLIADIDALYQNTPVQKKVDNNMVSHMLLEMYKSHWSL